MILNSRQSIVKLSKGWLTAHNIILRQLFVFRVKPQAQKTPRCAAPLKNKLCWCFSLAASLIPRSPRFDSGACETAFALSLPQPQLSMAKSYWSRFRSKVKKKVSTNLPFLQLYKFYFYCLSNCAHGLLFWLFICRVIFEIIVLWKKFKISNRLKPSLLTWINQIDFDLYEKGIL